MQENKKKKDYLIYTLCYQFVICAILFGSIYALKVTNSDIYEALKNEYYNSVKQENIQIEKLDIPQSKEEPTTNIPTTEPAPTKEEKSAETTLSASVKKTDANEKAEENNLPANISVNSYVLNQKMVLPVKGTITSKFGMRKHPISNKDDFHAGVDIAAATGTPIRSAFDGEVIVADYDDWNGYYLKIKHEGEITTVYCHCLKLNVSKGDIVKAGDVVALLGSTGSSTGPHLHFEFRIANISYDPESALNEAINAV